MRQKRAAREGGEVTVGVREASPETGLLPDGSAAASLRDRDVTLVPSTAQHRREPGCAPRPLCYHTAAMSLMPQPPSGSRPACSALALKVPLAWPAASTVRCRRLAHGRGPDQAPRARTIAAPGLEGRVSCGCHPCLTAVMIKRSPKSPAQRCPTALKLSRNRTSRFVSCRLSSPSIPRSALSCVRSRPMAWSTPASPARAEA
jgi:hypothetical protein